MYALVAIALAVNAGPGDIQGTWTGTGRTTPYTAVFCFDVLAMRVGTDPILETQESRFQVRAAVGEIDIMRNDGIQLGLYSIEDDRLTIMLADVNLPRPESLDFPVAKPTRFPMRIDRRNWTPPTQQQYVFERVK